jgi:hypothetical protein
MSILKEIKKTAKGMLLDGIGASQHIDSSGEILDVKGCDISDVEEGVAVINYEHKDNSATDIIGRLVYAKKIFSEEDCDDERQLMYWKKTGVPYIYIIGELMDDDDHSGAKDAAAIVRHYHRRGLPILARWSIEGSTLDKKGNHLKRSIFKRIALTLKPCNKDATSGLIFDPLDSKNKKDGVAESSLKTVIDKIDKFEHPGFTKLGGSIEVECMPFIDLEKREDKLPGGAADNKEYSDFDKEQLKVGIKHELEHTKDPKIAAEIAMDHLSEDPDYYKKLSTIEKDDNIKTKLKNLVKDWNGEGDIKKFIKSNLPEIADEFIDRFVDVIDGYKIKMKKFERLEQNILQLMKAVESVVDQSPSEEAQPKEQKHVEFGGKKIKPGSGTFKEDAWSFEGKRNPVSILGHNPEKKSFFIIPSEKINSWSDQDLKEVGVDNPGFRLGSYPEEMETPSIVDSNVHGVRLSPEAKELVNGLDLDPKKAVSRKHLGSARDAYWTKTPSGKLVFVKPDENAFDDSGFSTSEKENAFIGVSRDFFGLGNYFANVGIVKHPKTNQLQSVIEAIDGEHGEKPAKDNTNIPKNQHHINVLHKLGDSGELDKLAIIDGVLGNFDRHYQNYLFTPNGSIKLIDHGESFDNDPTNFYFEPDYLDKYHSLKDRQIAPGGGLDHNRFHPETLRWLQGLDTKKFEEVLRTNGVPDNRAKEAIRRLNRIKLFAQNPNLDKKSAYIALSRAD